MDTLKDILVYIFQNYPNPSELSKPRLVKLIYLSDWKSSIKYNKQITSVNWFFNHYGPYVESIINYIKSDVETFNVDSTENIYGGKSEKIKLKEGIQKVTLSKEVKEVVDFVIENTYNLSWNDFLTLVYSTYPIKNSSKYSTLDLVSFAKEYRTTF